MDHDGNGLQGQQELALQTGAASVGSSHHLFFELPLLQPLTSSSPILANSYRKAKYSVRCLLWGLTPCSMMDRRVFTKRVTQERLPMSSTGPSMSSELRGQKHEGVETKTSAAHLKRRDPPVLHPRLQVQVGVNRSQPLDDMNAQPLEHLEDRAGRL